MAIPDQPQSPIRAIGRRDNLPTVAKTASGENSGTPALPSIGVLFILRLGVLLNIMSLIPFLRSSK